MVILVQRQTGIGIGNLNDFKTNDHEETTGLESKAKWKGGESKRLTQLPWRNAMHSTQFSSFLKKKDRTFYMGARGVATKVPAFLVSNRTLTPNNAHEWKTCFASFIPSDLTKKCDGRVPLLIDRKCYNINIVLSLLSFKHTY
jgi:hypothetical protein